MYRVHIEYKSFLGDESQMYLGIRLHHPEPGKDGIYIASDCIVGNNLLKGLTKKRIDSLIQSLIPSLEACMIQIDERINKEKI